jgi:hypothetical protein
MTRLALLMLALAPAAALADTLQFQTAEGGAFASYAHVQVWDAQGQVVYNGAVDGYGRLPRTLPAGDYKVSLTTRTGVKTTAVHLAGTEGLRVVTL